MRWDCLQWKWQQSALLNGEINPRPNKMSSVQRYHCSFFRNWGFLTWFHVSISVQRPRAWMWQWHEWCDWQQAVALGCHTHPCWPWSSFYKGQLPQPGMGSLGSSARLQSRVFLLHQALEQSRHCCCSAAAEPSVGKLCWAPELALVCSWAAISLLLEMAEHPGKVPQQHSHSARTQGQLWKSLSFFLRVGAPDSLPPVSSGTLETFLVAVTALKPFLEFDGGIRALPSWTAPRVWCICVTEIRFPCAIS